METNKTVIRALHYKQESKSNPSLSFELEITRCFASEKYKMFSFRSNKGFSKKRILPDSLINAGQYFLKSDISSWKTNTNFKTDVYWEVAMNLDGEILEKQGFSAITDSMKAMYFINGIKELFSLCDIEPIDRWDSVFLWRPLSKDKTNNKSNWISDLFNFFKK